MEEGGKRAHAEGEQGNGELATFMILQLSAWLGWMDVIDGTARVDPLVEDDHGRRRRYRRGEEGNNTKRQQAKNKTKQQEHKTIETSREHMRP